MTVHMQRSPQMTRDVVIFCWTALMQQQTGCSDETFAIRVVEWYHANVPKEARSLTFQTEGDVIRCAKTNANRLMRFTKREFNSRMPTEIEEAWVMGGLVEPYRSECRRELAHRYGLLAVELPQAGKAVGLQSLGAFTSEMGQALQVLGPIFADGQIDDTERQHLPAARKEIEKLIASAETLLAQINQAST